MREIVGAAGTHKAATPVRWDLLTDAEAKAMSRMLRETTTVRQLLERQGLANVRYFADDSEGEIPLGFRVVAADENGNTYAYRTVFDVQYSHGA